MDKYAAGTRASDLSLVEIPKRPDDSPPADANLQAQADTDRFVEDARREFHSGHIDQPLWARALAQAGGDEKLAMPAYLRARATALRLAERDERGGKTSRRALARHNRAEKDSHFRAKAASPAGGFLGTANRKYLIWAAGAVTGVVLVSVLVAMRSEGDATKQVAVDTQSRPPSPNTTDRVAGNNTVPAPIPGENFVARMQTLKDAGNWNVLVLYAVEWTRTQPENPVAWKELSSGYTKLRQFDDALSAAKKAVEIAPTDAAMWRNLGQVDLAINDPAAAAAAFERAATLNDQDVASLVELGTLYMGFGRIQDAKAAFAKALAAQPTDVDALCGNASVARQEGRTKDADAIVAEVKASGGICRSAAIMDAATVVARPPTNNKAAIIPRR